MPLILSQDDRAALEAAQAQRPKVRHCQRYWAMLHHDDVPAGE